MFGPDSGWRCAWSAAAQTAAPLITSVDSDAHLPATYYLCVLHGPRLLLGIQLERNLLDQKPECADDVALVGPSEPRGPQDQGTDEVSVPKLQPTLIKYPCAMHPPPQLPHGMRPVGVATSPRSKRRKGKGAQEHWAREEDSGAAKDLRGFVGHTFGVGPTLASQIVGVRVGSVTTNSPEITVVEQHRDRWGGDKTL